MIRFKCLLWGHDYKMMNTKKYGIINACARCGKQFDYNYSEFKVKPKTKKKKK